MMYIHQALHRFFIHRRFFIHIFALVLSFTLTQQALGLSNPSIHPATPTVRSLPALGVDLNNTSVSGLSSGGYMTGQFLMAHSAILKGAGIVGAGPYMCSSSWPLPYEIASQTTCKHPENDRFKPNTFRLILRTKLLSQLGKIDDIDHLKHAKYYIFSGKNDQTVTPIVIDQNVVFFESLGVKPKQIWYDNTSDAGHAFITDNPDDTDCHLTQSPYINNCGFSQAARILSHIYPNFDPTDRDETAKAVPFNQSEFIHEPFTSMDETAYVYIPPQCESGTICSVHIVFHGCRQGATVVGDKFYNGTGYNAYANANDLIMLYPQVHRSPERTQTEPDNPKGCWDYWGFSEPLNPFGDYYTQNAPQIRAVYRMLKRLASQP